MSYNDFIPRSDAEFNLWQINLMLILTPNIALWGILEADFVALQALQAAWNNAFEKGSPQALRTAGDVQRKKDARIAFEKAIRVFVAQWLANNTKVTNGDREDMGITVPSETRTRVQVPTESPYGYVDFSNPLQHIIHFRKSNEDPSIAKPEGVRSCEIWMKVGDPVPLDASELTYVAADTRTPYILNFTKEEIGKIVYYRIRWVNTRGELGPWSDIFSAIVAP